MSSYPHIYLASAPQPVKSLVDVAIDACIQHKHLLGDVGFMEASHLRRILPHCSRTQLETIEGMTLDGSGRDLSWFSWDCWYVIFNNLYGPPKPDELVELEAEVPEDYTPPPGHLQPADYRSMVLAREAETEARKQAAVNRLRGAYRQEQNTREALQVKYTEKMPPAKRARRGTVAMVTSLPLSQQRHIAGKPASKVLHNLGLASSGKPGIKQQLLQQQRTKAYGNGTYSTRPAPSSSSMQRPAGSSGSLSSGRSIAGNSSKTNAAAAGRTNTPVARQQQQQRGVGAAAGGQALAGQKRSSSGGSGRAGGVVSLDSPVTLSPQAKHRPPAAAAAGRKPAGSGSQQQQRQRQQLSGLLDRPVTLSKR